MSETQRELAVRARIREIGKLLPLLLDRIEADERDLARIAQRLPQTTAEFRALLAERDELEANP